MMISSVAVGSFNLHLAEIIHWKNCLTIATFVIFLIKLSYKEQKI